MRLRNKNTGDRGELVEFNDGFRVKTEHGYCIGIYDTLEALNKDWEDYKPSEIWYITSNGEIERGNADMSWVMEKAIGNYFETKKDAEEALEKLWAWKRLKDAGVKIVGWCYSDNVDLNGCGFNDDDFIVGLTAGECDQDDLDLLFGEKNG